MTSRITTLYPSCHSRSTLSTLEMFVFLRADNIHCGRFAFFADQASSRSNLYEWPTYPVLNALSKGFLTACALLKASDLMRTATLVGIVFVHGARAAIRREPVTTLRMFSLSIHGLEQLIIFSIIIIILMIFAGMIYIN